MLCNCFHVETFAAEVLRVFILDTLHWSLNDGRWGQSKCEDAALDSRAQIEGLSS